MPTIYRFKNCRVFFYSNDHSPAHVHVTCGDKEAVFNLVCDDSQDKKMRDNRGFSLKEVNAIYAELLEVMDMLCEEWRKVHG
jgi:Fe2+ or Zn2+ uptake regulation protein